MDINDIIQILEEKGIEAMKRSLVFQKEQKRLKNLKKYQQANTMRVNAMAEAGAANTLASALSAITGEKSYLITNMWLKIAEQELQRIEREEIQSIKEC